MWSRASPWWTTGRVAWPMMMPSIGLTISCASSPNRPVTAAEQIALAHRCAGFAGEVLPPPPRGARTQAERFARAVDADFGPGRHPRRSCRDGRARGSRPRPPVSTESPVEPQRLARFEQQHVDTLPVRQIAQGTVAQRAFHDHRRTEGHGEFDQPRVGRPRCGSAAGCSGGSRPVWISIA